MEVYVMERNHWSCPAVPTRAAFRALPIRSAFRHMGATDSRSGEIPCHPAYRTCHSSNQEIHRGPPLPFGREIAGRGPQSLLHRRIPEGGVGRLVEVDLVT